MPEDTRWEWTSVLAEVLMFLAGIFTGLVAGWAVEAKHTETAVTAGLWSLGFFINSAGYKAGRR